LKNHKIDTEHDVEMSLIFSEESTILVYASIIIFVNLK